MAIEEIESENSPALKRNIFNLNPLTQVKIVQSENLKKKNLIEKRKFRIDSGLLTKLFKLRPVFCLKKKRVQ